MKIAKLPDLLSNFGANVDYEIIAAGGGGGHGVGDGTASGRANSGGATTIPDEIEFAVTRRYGVDLESLAEGRARFYVDGDDPETVLLGFTYSAMGKLEEWKRYRRDPDSKQRLLIDRFDATGEAKSTGDVERAGGPDLWRGPLELPEKAKQAGLHVIYLAKETTDQSYLRVFQS